MTVRFTVTGEPQGKARPRVTGRGTYTPPKTKAYEQLVRLAYKTQCKNADFGTAPLTVSIRAYYAIPKSASKRQRERMLADKTWPAKKPDADNLAKAVLDVAKHWDETPAWRSGFRMN